MTVRGGIDLSNKKSLFETLVLKNINQRLLSRALTHRSYLNEHPEALEDNERLEFLGDAVLDFLVGAWLYHHFPEMKEGDLTRLRSALVRTDQLAAFASEIDLGSFILLGHGEEESGGRKRTAILCGTFEAIVGALYLQDGIPAVSKFIEPFLEVAVEQIIDERKDQDPKSMLQEWAQSHGYGTPVYRVISMNGPEHDKQFEIEVFVNDRSMGKGKASSKHLATKAAAFEALRTIDIEN
jgi:ribonuclease III